MLKPRNPVRNPPKLENFSQTPKLIQYDVLHQRHVFRQPWSLWCYGQYSYFEYFQMNWIQSVDQSLVKLGNFYSFSFFFLNEQVVLQIGAVGQEGVERFSALKIYFGLLQKSYGLIFVCVAMYQWTLSSLYSTCLRQQGVCMLKVGRVSEDSTETAEFNHLTCGTGKHSFNSPLFPYSG